MLHLISPLLVTVLTLPHAADKPIHKVSGVSIVAPPRITNYTCFRQLSEVSAEWAVLLPYGYCRNGEPEVFHNQSWQWWGETIPGIKRQAELAKREGLRLAIKPQLWVMGQGWVGSYDLDTEKEWMQWEEGYKDFIMVHARMAQEVGAEMLCIGTELKNASAQRPEFWRGLVKEVRKEFSGKLTYAANWDNFESVAFWDVLDFIGIDAYFPLSDANTPTVLELKRAWQVPLLQIKAVQEEFDKKVLFTEYGYKSTDGTAGRQWELNSRHARVNLEAQQNAYQACFEVFWEEPWFAGGFLWNWHIGNTGRQGRSDADYTPQGKPVCRLISKWYRL